MCIRIILAWGTVFRDILFHTQFCGKCVIVTIFKKNSFSDHWIGCATCNISFGFLELLRTEKAIVEIRNHTPD